MDNRFDNRYLSGDVPENTEGYYKDNTEETEEQEPKGRTVLDGVPRSRVWSVLSLILGILSIPLAGIYISTLPFITFIGLGFVVCSILFALISRRNLGYFDGLSVAGIIVGSIGLVFGITSIVLAFLLR